MAIVEILIRSSLIKMVKKTFIKPYSLVKKQILKYIAIASVIAALVIGYRYFPSQALMLHLLRWIEHLESWGPIAFIAIFNMATILFIPGSILTLGGGVIYGLMWGSIYVFMAAIIGAIVAFAIGRYISRDWVAGQMARHPNFKAIEEAVTHSGMKIVFLTRLCPIIPFNLANYAFGVTQVSFKDYIVGSIGILPGTIMYVYLGSLIGDLTTICSPDLMWQNPQTETIKWLVNGISVVTTIGITVYLGKIAKSALSEIGRSPEK